MKPLLAEKPLMSHVSLSRMLPVGQTGAQLECFTAPDTPETFIDEVIAGYNKFIPQAFQLILALSHKRLVLAQNPDALGRGSRIADETDFYKRAPAEVEGFYSPGPGAIVLTTESFSNKTGRYHQVNDVPQLLTHETVHGLDNTNLHVTFQDEFSIAYRLDAMRLTSNDFGWGYLLQKGNAGASEAFAEAGTQVLTGKCRSGTMDFDWPHTLSLTRTFLDLVQEGIDTGHVMKAEDPDRILNEEISFVGRDAMKEAEKRLLYQWMVKDQTCYDMIMRAKNLEQMRSDYFYDTSSNKEKKSIFLRAIDRQGLDEARKAWLEYRKLVASEGRICFPA